MERDDRPPLTDVRRDAAGLPRFYLGQPFRAGEVVTLDADAAHHMRVRRLAVGERVVLLDGAGSVGTGILVRLGRRDAAVDVERRVAVPRPPAVHMLVPVADRDRMLWLAEKCAELAAASWRPVVWRRSSSVSPRGSGAAFDAKVRARLIAALAQSGGAWLPAMEPATAAADAAAHAPEGTRILLDRSGQPLLTVLRGCGAAAITIATGPEGGVDADERAMLVHAGFIPATLGETILRFETASIAALATARVVLAGADARGAGAAGEPPRTGGEGGNR